MNDDDLRMLDEWRHGQISDADFATMQERLREDAELRAEFRALAAVEEGLHTLATPAQMISVVKESVDAEKRTAPVASTQKKSDQRSDLEGFSPFEHPLFGRFAKAAALVLLGVGLTIYFLSERTTRITPITDSGWEITNSYNAGYEEVSLGHLRLESGEIRVAVKSGETLKITTPNAEVVLPAKPAGDAEISGPAEFIIGAHQVESSDFNENDTTPETESIDAMNTSLTRILVMAGAISLTTAGGTVEAAPGELAVAEGGAAPEVIVVSSNNSFAFDVYKQMASEKAGENLFLSPYSIVNALTMLSEGARGETAEEIGDMLNFPEEARRIGGDGVIPWETAKMHAGIGSINRKLIGAAGDAEYTLDLANSLWVDKGFNLADEFSRKVIDAYGTGAANQCDFRNSPEEERKRLNAWVEEKTREKIKDLFPGGSIKDNTVMVLANAIYFKGDWQTQFDPKKTHDAKFTKADSSTSTVKMMRIDELGDARYAALNPDGSAFRGFPGRMKEGLEILELPYKGGALSMMVVLPRSADGLAELEKEINATKLEQWESKLRKQELNVQLPKFSFDSGGSIKATLEALGMKKAFNGGRAELEGLGSSPLGRLYVSNVFHKAFIDVNEEGSEAAAATGVVVAAESARIVPTFKADRPFLFLIRDVESGTALFMGRVMEP